MANTPNRSSALAPPTLAPHGQRVPETALTHADLEDDPEPPSFDIASFDPNDYEWRPVPRRPRSDGWVPEVQRKFIETLADTGLVSAACEAVDMSVQSAYRLRRAPGSEGFARAWDAATAAAATRLIDIAFSRAIEGVDIPVFDRDGCRIGSKRSHSDRLMMFLIRAYGPDLFRHAGQDVRRRSESPAPPVEHALAALTPPPPADPHRLMSPDALADAVDAAEAMANLHDCHPDLDRERYVRPRVEANHPKATERASARRQRERERDAADEYDD